ncbi:MAG: CpsD/CapB family tyrosine-protein kinase [Rubrivivax sp.]|nr:CpsD/CapB family tyrosine-protein kinase [Rubrivivax sp.]
MNTLNALNDLMAEAWRLSATGATPPPPAAAPRPATVTTAQEGQLAPELVTVHAPGSAAAEGFRTLRSQLAMRAAGASQAGPALAVIGTGRGDGRSWCAANLAVSMAQRGGPVLLLDANLRQPRLHTLFGLPGTGGLAALLRGQLDAEPVQPVPQVPGLFLLAAGDAPTHALELLEQPGFARLLQTLGTRYAQVIVDTPAAALGADAAVIAARCDAALLVVRRHASGVSAVQALREDFAPSGKPVVGVLLNGY